jgi:DNA-binding IclR family transcriptional regulator
VCIQPGDGARQRPGVLLASLLGAAAGASDVMAIAARALSLNDALPRFTSCTVTDLRRLTAELEQVREGGWASEVEELIAGEASCAAPIHDRRGLAVGSIAISGPVERLCEGLQPRSDLVSNVREGARTISRDLGAVPW